MVDATFIPKSLVDETLRSKSTVGKKLLEPLKSFALQHAVPLHILDNATEDNCAEIHTAEADLWICLSGKVRITTGGTLTNPHPLKLTDGSINEKEIQGDSIEGRTTHMLSEGDALFIPAGVPHLQSSSETARLFIIKVP